MSSRISYDEVTVGQQIAEEVVTLRRVDLLRYCGACSDFTGTHWNERIAKSVGLPNVISHGTLNIAVATRIVSDWLGDPAAVLGYDVTRFSHPVVVPDDDEGGHMIVRAVVEDKADDRRAVIRLTAKTPDGKQVMGGARVSVQLA
ncbi:MaoC/PaaZ C-terminal domain-containing protein [Nocardia terpenica]|uniref:Dehydratase n=1 Tax=Nocardia terpenica TaxID=455432 RepID=A0A6G9Z533_9NOCA|nr:MaoC/PaaZ C-terminal domain-containing protein [Nocardia terpenica]QIS20699.1 dehydratase [Nocardia terpenica]